MPRMAHRGNKNGGSSRDKLFNAGTHRQNRCDHCESCFDSETEVEVHKKLSHKTYLERMYIGHRGCHICQHFYPNKQALKDHFEKDHLFISNKDSCVGRPLFICDECDMFFFNKTMLQIHQSQKHFPELRDYFVPCPICNKVIRNKYALQHMDLIHTRSLRSCPVCLKRQRTVASLPAHVAAHHPERFLCHVCKKTFDSATVLNEHLSSQHGKTAVGSDAAFCSARFFSNFSLNRKVKVKRMTYPHRGFTPEHMCAVCLLCQKVVYNTADMVSHMLSNHGHTYAEKGRSQQPAERPPASRKVCDCGASFINEVMLKHHKFKMHTLLEREAPTDLEEAETKEEERKTTIVETISLDSDTFQIVIVTEDEDECAESVGEKQTWEEQVQQ